MAWDARLETKLDKIVDKISRIEVTLAEQHVSLKEHMRRSDLLEKKLAPVETHVNRMNGALKLLGSAGALIALLKYILKII